MLALVCTLLQLSLLLMINQSNIQILDKWFESEPLKATLATDSCIGAMIRQAVLRMRQ